MVQSAAARAWMPSGGDQEYQIQENVLVFLRDCYFSDPEEAWQTLEAVANSECFGNRWVALEALEVLAQEGMVRRYNARGVDVWRADGMKTTWPQRPQWDVNV